MLDYLERAEKLKVYLAGLDEKKQRQALGSNGKGMGGGGGIGKNKGGEDDDTDADTKKLRQGLSSKFPFIPEWTN